VEVCHTRQRGYLRAGCSKQRVHNVFQRQLFTLIPVLYEYELHLFLHGSCFRQPIRVSIKSYLFIQDTVKI